ncbi:MAG TPA: DUF4232 domain-containing protein [Actinophytocola sp.]|jgi:hypothetical protein|uniref:DUF4232 domain-containing protein n=1 Tax=Actinophytocola sp. TaxID=1872138 RepID=UPI002E0780AD|nr:DUF4232 domain-containing protein [Actinophytocola sp.]
MRALVLSTVTAATLILLAGCGGSNQSAGSSSSAAPTTTTTSAPATTHTTSASHQAGATAASFKADLTVQGEGSALLTLTNSGSQSVTIQGWPTLKFLGANNGALAVPEQKVEKPGAGPQVTLAPGRTAFAGIKWVLGDKADTSTFVATSVTVTPPNHTAVKANLIGTDGKVAGYLELPLKSVQVGTLQPSSQGVLF